MNENTYTPATEEEELDAIMPEGWGGGEEEDFFNPATWGIGDSAADAQDEDDADEDGDSDDDEAGSRTTEDGDEAGVNGADDKAPTTGEKTKGTGKLRFSVQLDHENKDIELDRAELPAIYQRAQVQERYQARVQGMEAEFAQWDAVARALGYDDRNALRDGVMESTIQNYMDEHPSVPEDMARDYFQRKFGVGAAPEDSDAPGGNASEEEEETTDSRDFKREVRELFEAYPDARGEKIPDEVTTEAIVKNKPLVQAYAEYAARRSASEARSARRENKILKQNQAAAAKAPVSKVTGGGKTDTKPMDAFLQGFNAETDW